jgi:hypothetical protein
MLPLMTRSDLAGYMKVYTPWELNAMSLDEREAALDGEFGRSFHISAGEHVTWIFWARDTKEPAEILGHGSAFILNRGGRLMLVTAAHVYRQYLNDQRREGRLYCQVANTVVKDLSSHLIACGNLDLSLDEPDIESDIAPFRLTRDAALRIGKRPISALGNNWPPPPKPGEQVMFCGYPGQERVFVSPGEINFGLHSGMTRAASVTDHQITMRFERDFMIDQHGTGLPPVGYGLGGISGGPLLVPDFQEGAWAWRLGGVIVQAPDERPAEEVLVEMVVAHRAQYIQGDGTLAKSL